MGWLASSVTWTLLLVFSTKGEIDPFKGQPRIVVEDGHLIFDASLNGNITFRSTGSGRIRVNDNDLLQLLQTVQASVADLNQFKTIDVNYFTNRIEELNQQISGIADFNQRLNSLQNSVTNLTNQVARLTGPGNRRMSLLQVSRKVQRLETQFRSVKRLLQQNECNSNPCQHGGICVDAYNGFVCQCPSNWQGTLCEEDVNECQSFQGTDIGCQNSGTCTNFDGGYSCSCPDNFHGIHCTETSDQCGSASHTELCGHGTCVNDNRAVRGQAQYRCICDQGYTAESGSNPACIHDVDECNATNQPPPCSPLVACRNVPGSFLCGPCPAGYTGNGFSCHDINECETNNGGCSVTPRVDCLNTQGSRICGPCPTEN